MAVELTAVFCEKTTSRIYRVEQLDTFLTTSIPVPGFIRLSTFESSKKNFRLYTEMFL